MPGCICNDCTNYGDENACLSVLNILFDNITTTSFGVSWDLSPNALSYVVEYKEISSTTWLIMPAVTAPTVTDTVTGLTPDTVYDVRINTVCNGTTCYSLTHRVQTLETT